MKMTQRERMDAGLIYDPGDEEIMSEQRPYSDNMRKYNSLPAGKERSELLKKMLGACGEHCYIEPPFYGNWAGKHLYLGEGVYANFALTLVDDGDIFVGDHVMFGPNVTITTANHPIEPSMREKGLQYNKPVRIGNNAWIGAGAIILPGVTIGENTVIGAGSVVTKDIPANVVAVGTPCRVMREIGEHDREYFFRDEKIDWENL